MRFGNRGPRSLGTGRREAFRPGAESLEERLLLAIDLGGPAPPSLPNIATAPFGVDLAGTVGGQGAGYSVADVGNISGSGFNSYAVGAPSITSSGANINLGSSASAVYLVFGSQTATNTTADWLTLTANQRVSNLSQLGTTTQTNPINGAATNPYGGVTFVTGSTSGSQLGASVAVVNNLNSLTNPSTGKAYPDLLIGAPGASEAFLVYGGPQLLKAPLVNGIPTIDFDDPTSLAGTGINFVKFTSTTNSQVGFSVASGGSVISAGVSDLLIGAPNATINGITTGAVYLVAGTALTVGTTQTINLNLVGQSGGPAGVIFTGETSGSRTGYSVAGAGDVNGAVNGASAQIGDVLIGAPQAVGSAGKAYLIYGGTNLTSLTILPVGATTRVLPLARVGTPNGTTITVPGATFTGAASGWQTGYAVASAGDFNNDGFGDFQIGSPGANANIGLDTLIYGRPNSNLVEGNFTLNALPANIFYAIFNGVSAGDRAGSALGFAGQINLGSTSKEVLLLGAPGANGGDGIVYVIPGRPDTITNSFIPDIEGGFFVQQTAAGGYLLSQTEASPLSGLQISDSETRSAVSTPSLGTSVSGSLTVTGQTHTADSDLIADFILGAPGTNITANLNGNADLVQGAKISVPVPTSNTIQPGVTTAFNAANSLLITVFSSNIVSPVYNPNTDINPASLVIIVGGHYVYFSNLTGATFTQIPSQNGNGIPFARITIPASQLSKLGLTTTSRGFGLTLVGQSPNTSPNFPKQTVGIVGSGGVIGGGGTGGGGGGGGGGGSSTSITGALGIITPTTFIPQFGPDNFVPTLADFSALDYKAIPLSVAVKQYLPALGFGARTQAFFHPNQARAITRNGAATGLAFQKNKLHLNIAVNSRVPTRAFTINNFNTTKTVTFTHKVRVVPVQRQTQVIRATPLKHPTNTF
jgi:hypothetical protein